VKDLVASRLVQGVSLVLPVYRESRNAVLGLEKNVLVYHASFHYMETGKRVRMTAAWGSTETAPQLTIVHFEPLRTSVVGLPSPGYELKMVPVDAAGKC
jgi:acyl-CoA synthetase (AMP-forming)/AMP-acid ligase II